MIDRIANNSLKEGRKRSRLPEFDEYWTKYIQGTADYMGINYYTSYLVDGEINQSWASPSFDRDQQITTYGDPNWDQARSKYIFSVPEGFGECLRLVLFFSFAKMIHLKLLESFICKNISFIVFSLNLKY